MNLKSAQEMPCSKAWHPEQKGKRVIYLYFSLSESIHNYTQGHSFSGANPKQKFMSHKHSQTQYISYYLILYLEERRGDWYGICGKIPLKYF